jgi:ubiquinone/menaquinone biosynthesis C-methylase UbiE
MRALAGVVAAGLALGAAAEAPQHARGRHGNPEDIDAYISRLESSQRAEWQKPDEVVRALALRPGQTACDVGAGPGYFTLRLARAVGAGGKVYAVDVEPRLIEALRRRLDSARITNVTPLLAPPEDPTLPDAACDVVLIVDTYHHFPDGRAYLRRLRRALRPGGRVVNIDYDKRPTPVGPPLDHRISRDDFLKEARSAGYRLREEVGFLPHQYFLVLEPE